MGKIISGILPPWARLVPWVLALVFAVALWAMWERQGKLAVRADSAIAAADEKQRRIESQQFMIEAMQRDADRNDAILAERERYIQRSVKRMREVADGISSLMAGAERGDCIRQPIGADAHRVLSYPPDPADDEPSAGEPIGDAPG